MNTKEKQNSDKM